jgi:cytochrome c biogenesis protein CcdA
VLGLVALVALTGIVDSLNPTMIVVALYLAAGERPRARVAQFTGAVFVVYLAAGVAIVLGPGQLLLSVVPHPGPEARHIGEIVVGVALLVAATWLWWFRRRLSGRVPPAVGTGGRSSALLGAGMTAVELPTAFPYLAAIGAIIDSGFDAPRQLGLLVLFNVCFVAPLVLIVVVLRVAGKRAEPVLGRARRGLERRWPVVLAGVALLAGGFVLTLGATGLASSQSPSRPAEERTDRVVTYGSWCARCRRHRADGKGSDLGARGRVHGADDCVRGDLRRYVRLAVRGGRGEISHSFADAMPAR